jgi:hypothetical protein
VLRLSKEGGTRQQTTAKVELLILYLNILMMKYHYEFIMIKFLRFYKAR